MLIFLYICSFLMSYDSSDISLGDIETIILYNLDCQSREMHSFLIKLFFLSFVYWDPFLILKDSLISSETFHLAFWYLLYSATFMFLRQPGICQFTSSNFHIIPYWSPWTSPWKTFPKSHPRKNFNFFYFLWWFKQSPSR